MIKPLIGLNEGEGRTGGLYRRVIASGIGQVIGTAAAVTLGPFTCGAGEVPVPPSFLVYNADADTLFAFQVSGVAWYFKTTANPREFYLLIVNPSATDTISVDWVLEGVTA